MNYYVSPGQLHSAYKRLVAQGRRLNSFFGLLMLFCHGTSKKRNYLVTNMQEYSLHLDNAFYLNESKPPREVSKVSYTLFHNDWAQTVLKLLLNNSPISLEDTALMFMWNNSYASGQELVEDFVKCVGDEEVIKSFFFHSADVNLERIEPLEYSDVCDAFHAEGDKRTVNFDCAGFLKKPAGDLTGAPFYQTLYANKELRRAFACYDFDFLETYSLTGKTKDTKEINSRIAIKTAFYNWLLKNGSAEKTATSYSVTCMNLASSLLSKDLYNFRNHKIVNELLNELQGCTEWTQKNSDGKRMYDSGIKKYIEFLKEYTNSTILSKPFLLLAGISGTGKTRFVLDQAVRSGGGTADDSEIPDNYELVAVRPDWHEPSDLLGYVSRLGGEKYVPTGFLSFLVKAWKEVFDEKGSLKEVKDGTRPFWLCLDEMNLAPVEQYFADYLSILESRKWADDGYSSLPIIGEKELGLVREALEGNVEDEPWKSFIANKGIPIPPNLIVAGTVNMDETTHGFSRKVIDRALTLDFQEFFPNIYKKYFNPSTEPVIFCYSTESHVKNRKQLSNVSADVDGEKSIAFLDAVNKKLKSTPFELAYRALNELLLSVKCFAPADDKALYAVWDDYLMQKVLPRIEGDAEKLRYTGEEDSGILNELKTLITNMFKGVLDKDKGGNLKRPDLLNQRVDASEEPLECSCKSLEKIGWMQDRLEQNQYTSFWA